MKKIIKIAYIGSALLTLLFLAAFILWCAFTFWVLSYSTHQGLVGVSDADCSFLLASMAFIGTGLLSSLGVNILIKKLGRKSLDKNLLIF
ncbi:MAG: hypothetical protein ACM3PZ_02145 [Bacillota bacterium]